MDGDRLDHRGIVGESIKRRLAQLEIAELSVARRERDLIAREAALDKRIKTRLLGRQDANDIVAFVNDVIAALPPPPVVHRLAVELEDRALELEELSVAVDERENELKTLRAELDARATHLKVVERHVADQAQAQRRIQQTLDEREKRIAAAADSLMRQEAELADCATTMEQRFRDATRELEEIKARMAAKDDKACQVGSVFGHRRVDSMTQTSVAGTAAAATSLSSRSTPQPATWQEPLERVSSAVLFSAPSFTATPVDTPLPVPPVLAHHAAMSASSSGAWTPNVGVVQHFAVPPNVPLNDAAGESPQLVVIEDIVRVCEEGDPFDPDLLDDPKPTSVGSDVIGAFYAGDNAAATLTLRLNLDGLREREAAVREKEQSLAQLSRYVIQQRKDVEQQLQIVESRAARLDEIASRLEALGLVF